MRLARPALICFTLLILSGCQTTGSQSDDAVMASDSTPSTMGNTSSPEASSQEPVSSEAAVAAPNDSAEASATASSMAKESAPASTTQACPSQPKPECKVAANPLGDKLIIGEVEKILVNPGDFVTAARIDTGATTTSVHAVDVVEFERDGKKWVKFNTLSADGKGKQEIKGRVTRMVSIKRHGAEDSIRYAVKLNLTIGKTNQLVEVTLADRSSFDYKVLVGRNLLKDIFVVDVGKKLAAGTPTAAGN